MRVYPWVLRVAWAVLPFTAGPALAAALHDHATAVRTAASVGLWSVWAAVVVATLVAHPLSLTIIRTTGPGAVAAVVAAAGEGRPSTTTLVVGLISTMVVLVIAFLPVTAMVYINGPAYPNERRYPLALPSALFFGPLELAWVAIVGLPAGAVILLAAHQWIAGAVVALAAGAALPVMGRALHGLSRRWVVFVPAGVVLHDPMSLIDPVLFPRQIVERLGPAPADTDALDLTHNANGLAVELVLAEKVPLVRITPGHRRGEPGSSARLMFTPSRPGAVLADASRRRFPVVA